MNRLNLCLAVFLFGSAPLDQAFAQDVGARAIPKAMKKEPTKRRKAASERGPKIRTEAFFRKRYSG